MSRQNVGKECGKFEAGRSDIHHEIRSGRPSVVNDKIIQRIYENIRADNV
jgi:hypothetical protein